MAIEKEAKFLNIDKDDLIKVIIENGGKDHGEHILEEIIFYDPDLKWQKDGKFIRLRKKGDKITITYKHHKKAELGGALEHETTVGDIHTAKAILESAGLLMYRHQEKKRHSLSLGETVFDIDTWPQAPSYLEIEGQSEEVIRNLAEKIGLKWKDAIFEDARAILKKYYNIDLDQLKEFCF